MHIEELPTVKRLDETKQAILDDLEWYFKISKKLASLDPQQRAEGLREKDHDAVRFIQLAAKYGIEMNLDDMEKLIDRLKQELS